MDKTYTVRTMTREDLDTAIEWAAKEGWNPGLHDADCFFQIDKNGFFMGFLNDEPIACISAVSYDKDFGFLGFYICRSEYRNQGYGIQVWNRAISYLNTQNIGLDGVVEQQENYKKAGFTFAYNNARYQMNSRKMVGDTFGIVRGSSVSIDEILQYDRQFFPADRATFIRYWIDQPESTALVSIASSRVQGYGMIRKCRTGYKIGPLFADTAKVAHALFESLISSVPESLPVILDIPEINADAVHLVNTYSMEKGFSTARMYTKTPPKLPIDRIYGITTFEIG